MPRAGEWLRGMSCAAVVRDAIVQLPSRDEDRDGAFPVPLPGSILSQRQSFPPGRGPAGLQGFFLQRGNAERGHPAFRAERFLRRISCRRAERPPGVPRVVP